MVVLWGPSGWLYLIQFSLIRSSVSLNKIRELFIFQKQCYAYDLYALVSSTKRSWIASIVKLAVALTLSGWLEFQVSEVRSIDGLNIYYNFDSFLKWDLMSLSGRVCGKHSTPFAQSNGLIDVHFWCQEFRRGCRFYFRLSRAIPDNTQMRIVTIPRARNMPCKGRRK